MKQERNNRNLKIRAIISVTIKRYILRPLTIFSFLMGIYILGKIECAILFKEPEITNIFVFFISGLATLIAILLLYCILVIFIESLQYNTIAYYMQKFTNAAAYVIFSTHKERKEYIKSEHIRFKEEVQKTEKKLMIKNK